MSMNAHPFVPIAPASARRRRQGGVAMLEALIAILIFSIGILSIIGMQGSAVRATSDAKYRSDAALLANNLIGQMWGSNRAAAVLQTAFQGGGGTDGASYTTWTNDAQSGVFATLPGAITNPPVVTVSATGLVTIQISWQAPGEDAAAPPHTYTVVAQID